MTSKIVIEILLLMPVLLFVGCTETIPVASSDLLVLNQKKTSQWLEAEPHDLWKVPVGPSLVEDMILLSPARLLVGLKNYDQEISNGDYLLLDTSTGRIQWRYKRSRIGDYSILDSAEDRIVFRVDEAGKVCLVGLDSKTGKQIWLVISKKAFVQIVVLYEIGIIAVVEGAGNIATVAGYDRSSGERLWEREFALDSDFDRDTALLAMWDRLWYVGSGVECLNGRNGETVWNRDDINPRGAGPNPQLGDGVVTFIDRRNRLMLLDAQSGNTRWSTSLPNNERFSSLFPGQQYVYVRSKTDTARPEPYKLSVVSLKSGMNLWDSWFANPTLSNILEVDRFIFVSTGTSMFCLDAKTGEKRFEMFASMVGGSYPVKIRRVGKSIVYLGELTIAAFDENTGETKYKNIVEPITQLTTVDAVLSYMTKVEAQLGQGKVDSGQVYLPSNTYQRYQDQANFYQKQYWDYSYGATRDTAKAKLARIQYSINNNWARQAAVRDFCNAIENLGTAMVAAQQQAYHQADLAKLRRLRVIYRSLIGSYAMAEDAEYAYRPHRENTLIGIMLTHLPTGASRFHVLSPTYEEYGLWAMLDLDRGVVYHHGMRRTDSGGKPGSGPFMTHLIASKIDIQRGR